MATIYDVARSAGVSPKTVSRVINKDSAVKDSTREIVEQKISELGYVPSTAARVMRSNKSGLVGLITGAISLTPSRAEFTGLPDLFIVQGIQKAIENSGKTLLIADTGGDMTRVPQLIRTFEEHRVEGIIYVADYHRKVDMPTVSPSTKLVLANCYDDIGTPSIVPNDYRGQFDLVRELIAKGHQRIAYLTLQPRLIATQERTKGYIDALQQAGLEYDPDLLIPAELDSAETELEEQLLWDALDRVISLPNPPSVICFGNDRMAMRAYGILRSRGISLPEDLSVAGYDNHRLITQTLYPTLMSAELPYAAIGIRATETLLALIDNQTQPNTPIRVSGPVAPGNSVRDLPKPIKTLTSVERTKR